MRAPRGLAALGAALATLVLAGLAFAHVHHEAASAQPTASSPSELTATVARRDLVNRMSVSGVLGFGDLRPLTTPLGGTITELPEEGVVIRRGGVILRLDNAPVVLFYGPLPAWRSLGLGIEPGRDVLELERNLASLGFPAGALDERFDSATRRAVARWQHSIGLPATGLLRVGQAVFAPGPRRVGRVSSYLGERVAPNRPLLETSSLSHRVVLRVDAAQQRLVRPGISVRVLLPAGQAVTGHVSSVGRVASRVSADEPPTVRVTIAVPARRLGGLDGAPVTVEIEARRERAAVTVPVTALLALAGGGYAVERADAKASRLLRVTPGAFADGYVQISGTGIVVGLRVRTA